MVERSRLERNDMDVATESRYACRGLKYQTWKLCQETRCASRQSSQQMAIVHIVSFAASAKGRYDPASRVEGSVRWVESRIESAALAAAC